jgi:ADP-dependent NAD(P)H-hydrate dehydratase
VDSAERVIALDDRVLCGWTLPTASEGDKEDRGRVLIVAGSTQIPGAAVLAATAALRAGAGKVTIATPASIAERMAFAVPESRVIALPETAEGGIAAAAVRKLEPLADRADALLVGPGLTYEPSTSELTFALLTSFTKPGIILDAAAMDVAMKAGGSIWRFVTPVLLTPHAGEMAKLTGADKDEIVANCLATARDAARDLNAIVALKGAVTHIAAPDGLVWRHDRGNFGLATSGSGDVLAGIIAGLVARGAALAQAAVWGVALHARAGERLAERLGPIGYVAREISAEVPAIMAALTKAVPASRSA